MSVKFKYDGVELIRKNPTDGSHRKVLTIFPPSNGAPCQTRNALDIPRHLLPSL